MSCILQNELDHSITMFCDDSNAHITAHHNYLAKKHNSAILLANLNQKTKLQNGNI